MGRSGWLATGAFVLGLWGCGTPAVGDPCLPEQVPEDGFNDQETYIEAGSVQCQTRACMVFRLAGDPREGCDPVSPECEPEDTACIRQRSCADQQEVKKHVYCTCRCNAAGAALAECECPSGYSCLDVLDSGGPGVRGGYCVLNGTFTR